MMSGLQEFSMRIFVAIPFPQPVKDMLHTLAQSATFKAKWEHPDNYHLTLRFIGDVDEEGYARYVSALKTIQASTFDMTLQGVGRFPPEAKKPARVLWVGVAASPKLIALERAISAVLESNGLPKDKHETYHPHMTLARFKENPPSEPLNEFLQQHASFQIEPLRVDAFVLYQSTLTPQRAVYTEIERFGLDG
jgi:RNA 2',3'-cyclic 3'-phosphodiesterase